MAYSIQSDLELANADLRNKLDLALKRIRFLEEKLEETLGESAAPRPPKGACVVIVNGVPRASTLTHSAAYELMQRAKARGHRALYRPYN